METGKTGKYFKYAIGEIVLVVIGILIALQINNWNEERIEKTALNGLLQSISSGVNSDLRDLNLLVTARATIGEKADSVFKIIFTENKILRLEEAFYITEVFADISNHIYFKSNLSAFESLKNSAYFGKLQGTDLALLLNAYYTNADKIKSIEENYNERLENLHQDWFAVFRNNKDDQRLFLRPWTFLNDFPSVADRYLEILKDVTTSNAFGLATTEPILIDKYEEQILMGNALMDMVKTSKTTFDEQTKHDFSGILYSFADADAVSILINGKIPSGFDIKYAASGLAKASFILDDNDYVILEYPENTFVWGSPYFEVNALEGRVNEMDFSDYTKLVLEMKGAVGGETFQITMKDKEDSSFGFETKLNIELTNEWKTYEIETSEFKTADMKIISVPLGFVFEGSVGRQIHVKSIQFKKD